MTIVLNKDVVVKMKTEKPLVCVLKISLKSVCYWIGCGVQGDRFLARAAGWYHLEARALEGKIKKRLLRISFWTC